MGVMVMIAMDFDVEIAQFLVVRKAVAEVDGVAVTVGVAVLGRSHNAVSDNGGLVHVAAVVAAGNKE